MHGNGDIVQAALDVERLPPAQKPQNRMLRPVLLGAGRKDRHHLLGERLGIRQREPREPGADKRRAGKVVAINKPPHKRKPVEPLHSHRPPVAGFLQPRGKEKNQPREQLRMPRGEEQGNAGREPAGHEDRFSPRTDFPQKLGERRRVVRSVHLGGRTFGFSETDDVWNDDLVVHHETRVNPRPLVGRCAEENPVQKDQGLAGPAHMVDHLAEIRPRDPRGEDRGGNRVRNRFPRDALHAVADGERDGSEDSDTDADAECGFAFPESHKITRSPRLSPPGRWSRSRCPS